MGIDRKGGQKPCLVLGPGTSEKMPKFSVRDVSQGQSEIPHTQYDKFFEDLT